MLVLIIRWTINISTVTNSLTFRSNRYKFKITLHSKIDAITWICDRKVFNYINFVTLYFITPSMFDVTLISIINMEFNIYLSVSSFLHTKLSFWDEKNRDCLRNFPWRGKSVFCMFWTVNILYLLSHKRLALVILRQRKMFSYYFQKHNEKRTLFLHYFHIKKLRLKKFSFLKNYILSSFMRSALP